LLASARRQRAQGIAAQLGCDDQTVRNAIHAFNAWAGDFAAWVVCAPSYAACHLRREQLQTLLTKVHGPLAGIPVCGHCSWQPVAFAKGMTPRPVSGGATRQALAALKTRWKRAKHWITSPDPAYVRKKNSATGSAGWRPRTRTGR
jgi:hypothetical protein